MFEWIPSFPEHDWKHSCSLIWAGPKTANNVSLGVNGAFGALDSDNCQSGGREDAFGAQNFDHLRGEGACGAPANIKTFDKTRLVMQIITLCDIQYSKSFNNRGPAESIPNPPCWRIIWWIFHSQKIWYDKKLMDLRLLNNLIRVCWVWNIA